MPENSTKNLNFELPTQSAAPAHRHSNRLVWLLIFIFLGVAANIIVSLIPEPITPSWHENAVLNADQLKKFALKLEHQGLNNSSANAWKEYITKAGLNDEDTALIWYRIGKLYQDNHGYEQALASYYRSESFFAAESIASEIAVRIQECLESLGKFSAMNHELANRVTMRPSEHFVDTEASVIAEIGNRKITTSDLDQMMENNIDQQIRMMAPSLPEKERNKQKEALLNQLSTPANRKMFLNQFVSEELLYRKAREDKLTEVPRIRDLLNDQERHLLARMVVDKEYEDQINLTESDLEMYYEANKNAFVKDDTQQPFEEVINDVYKALRSQKEQEVQQQLLDRLTDQYDVVIHQSAFGEDSSTPADTQNRKNQ